MWCINYVNIGGSVVTDIWRTLKNRCYLHLSLDASNACVQFNPKLIRRRPGWRQRDGVIFRPQNYVIEGSQK